MADVHMTPARVTALVVRAFDLEYKGAIKSIRLDVEREGVTLSVTYFAPDAATHRLVENLEEFTLVSKVLS